MIDEAALTIIDEVRKAVDAFIEEFGFLIPEGLRDDVRKAQIGLHTLDEALLSEPERIRNAAAVAWSAEGMAVTNFEEAANLLDQGRIAGGNWAGTSADAAATMHEGIQHALRAQVGSIADSGEIRRFQEMADVLADLADNLEWSVMDLVGALLAVSGLISAGMGAGAAAGAAAGATPGAIVGAIVGALLALASAVHFILSKTEAAMKELVHVDAAGGGGLASPTPNFGPDWETEVD